MQMFSSMVYTWLAAMVVLIIIEAVVPGLISIWFALGSLAAMISAFFDAPIWLQLVIFVVISAVSLVLTRPLVKKYVNSRTQPTNADATIGKECIVTSKIDNILGTGSVKVSGKDWTARSFSDDITIESGIYAVVEKIEGVKLIVKPKNN